MKTAHTQTPAQEGANDERGESKKVSERPRFVFGVVVALLVVHSLLLAWSALRNSPTWDEVGYLPSGVGHLRFGKFEYYRSNPPLVRMVAAVPVLLFAPEMSWERYRLIIVGRLEFDVGHDFIKANGEQSFWYFTLARWACIPFSLLGGYVCFRWARELYGDLAGILALTLWCFAPNVLAHGQLITPDVGGAAMGVAAGYAFWHWLKRPSWQTVLVAGVFLGLAELTRSTWVVLYGLWPLLYLAWRWPQRQMMSRRHWLGHGGQLCVILLLGLWLLNLGYLFEGSCQKLGDYEFMSQTFGGPEDSSPKVGEGRNRFANTWLGQLPVPAPKYYVRGIDFAKREFEIQRWAYLGGQWREHGSWYYYLYAFAVKVPLGTTGLMILALVLGLCVPGYSTGWRDELVLLAPLAIVLTLVSSQTNLNEHFRYVLPIFPFAYIGTSRVALAVQRRSWKIASLAAGAMLWSIGSSLSVYPHSLSYFNEAVGGPMGGVAHLAHGNTDWGQDLIYLKEWLDDHPEARPFGLSYYMFSYILDPADVGIKYFRAPPGPEKDKQDEDPYELGPKPGWYGVSVNHVYDRWETYRYFQHFEPVAMAGYSIYIYHITLDDANRVRRELGLPELPAPQSGNDDPGHAR